MYCRSGARSQSATNILKEKGFNAINMSGGMNAWNDNNLGGTDGGCNVCWYFSHLNQVFCFSFILLNNYQKSKSKFALEMSLLISLKYFDLRSFWFFLIFEKLNCCFWKFLLDEERSVLSWSPKNSFGLLFYLKCFFKWSSIK